jgi:hypothetical protein
MAAVALVNALSSPAAAGGGGTGEDGLEEGSMI